MTGLNKQHNYLIFKMNKFAFSLKRYINNFHILSNKYNSNVLCNNIRKIVFRWKLRAALFLQAGDFKRSLIQMKSINNEISKRGDIRKQLYYKIYWTLVSYLEFSLLIFPVWLTEDPISLPWFENLLGLDASNFWCIDCTIDADGCLPLDTTEFAAPGLEVLTL